MEKRLKAILKGYEIDGEVYNQITRSQGFAE